MFLRLCAAEIALEQTMQMHIEGENELGSAKKPIICMIALKPVARSRINMSVSIYHAGQ